MNVYARLVVKMVLITMALALLLFAAVMTTTLALQSHIHLDIWKTTIYNIATAAIVAVAYVAVMSRIVYNFLRARKMFGKRNITICSNRRSTFQVARCPARQVFVWLS